jgi:hypothetical protein
MDFRRSRRQTGLDSLEVHQALSIRKEKERENIMEDSKLENVLRKAAIALGGIILVASIYLSYDGFDQQVGVPNEGIASAVANDGYTPVAVAIGYALAITCTLLQFMVASKNENLNSTIRWLGVGAYAYSIGTNFLGLTNLLDMKAVMASISAVFMDVAPEQMIAWGLGEAVMHDLFGNFGKFATSPVGGKGRRKEDNRDGRDNKGGGGGERKHIPFPASLPRGQQPTHMSGPKPNGGTGPMAPINRENRGNSDKFRR